MNTNVALLILASLLATPLAWLLPRRWGLDAVAAVTALTLALLSPFSALWLAAAIGSAALAMKLGDVFAQRGLFASLAAAGLLAALVLSRSRPDVLWIGGAYFTLRILHVLFDWWMGRLAAPGLTRLVRYNFFLPVLATGPINRIQHFERQSERRRWDPSAFYTGAERALFGLAQATVLGVWLISHVERAVAGATRSWPPFLQDWSVSVIDWIQLYLNFAGLSSVALGLSLMMGLRLEENFNRPWAATNLIAFWTRWHMTLSFWCRDYVFNPVTALTRSPLAGLGAAMLAIALWHEISTYYLFWALWQVTGIVITRGWQTWSANRRAGSPSTPAWSRVLGPIAVLSWLSLARPTLAHVFGIAPL